MDGGCPWDEPFRSIANRPIVRAGATTDTIRGAHLQEEDGMLKTTLTAAIVGLAVAAAHAKAPIRVATVSHAAYGRTPEGAAVDVYTLTNASGMEVRAITYGGFIVSLRTPDR